MVAELIEQCVAGNDRVAPDQTEYRKKCDGLAGCRRLLFSLVFYGIFLQFAFSLGENPAQPHKKELRIIVCFRTWKQINLISL